MAKPKGRAGRMTPKKMKSMARRGKARLMLHQKVARGMSPTA